MENLHIRKANVGDAECITLLARVTFTETFGQYFTDHEDLMDYYDRTFTVSKIRSSLKNENNIFWIALWDELPVGYAKLKKTSRSEFIDSEKVSQLQKIYVLSDFFPKKIGQHLQALMFEATQLLNHKYLWLSVIKPNKRAIRFYEKSGFTIIGEHNYIIGKETFDYFVMKKEF